MAIGISALTGVSTPTTPFNGQDNNKGQGWNGQHDYAKIMNTINAQSQNGQDQWKRSRLLYDTAASLAQQDLAGEDVDDYELRDQIEKHIDQLQQNDTNEGAYRSARDIRSDLQMQEPGLLATIGSGIKRFNKGLGKGIDVVVDTVGGDIIGNAIGGQEMANNIKNATNEKTWEAPISIAEDIGLLASNAILPGVGTGLMIGKNVAEQGENIEKGLNGVMGTAIDPISGKQLSKQEAWGALGAGVLPAALAAAPLGIGKLMKREVGEVAGKAAKGLGKEVAPTLEREGAEIANDFNKATNAVERNRNILYDIENPTPRHVNPAEYKEGSYFNPSQKATQELERGYDKVKNIRNDINSRTARFNETAEERLPKFEERANQAKENLSNIKQEVDAKTAEGSHVSKKQQQELKAQLDKATTKSEQAEQEFIDRKNGKLPKGMENYNAQREAEINQIKTKPTKEFIDSVKQNLQETGRTKKMSDKEVEEIATQLWQEGVANGNTASVQKGMNAYYKQQAVNEASNTSGLRSNLQKDFNAAKEASRTSKDVINKADNNLDLGNFNYEAGNQKGINLMKGEQATGENIVNDAIEKLGKVTNATEGSNLLANNEGIRNLVVSLERQGKLEEGILKGIAQGNKNAIAKFTNQLSELATKDEGKQVLSNITQMQQKGYKGLSTAKGGKFGIGNKAKAGAKGIARDLIPAAAAAALSTGDTSQIAKQLGFGDTNVPAANLIAPMLLMGIGRKGGTKVLSKLAKNPKSALSNTGLTGQKVGRLAGLGSASSGSAYDFLKAGALMDAYSGKNAMQGSGGDQQKVSDAGLLEYLLNRSRDIDEATKNIYNPRGNFPVKNIPKGYSL